ncbi:glycosyltransferase family 2 protein [bacterium]|nr:glycosyltransferase family 2 protein [bacterium]
MAFNSPLVSVVINCFNGEAYLKEAIDSVYAQTYSNWEIIFWDNCSTDRSAEIAKSYGNKVRYFKAEKTTPLGEARNLALKQSQGDFIALLDSDDIWLPEKLTTQIQSITKNDAAVCFSGVIEIDESGTKLREINPIKKSGYMIEELLYQFDIYLSSIMFRRESLVKESISFDTHLVCSEEYNILMRLAAKYKFAVVSAALSKWRVHGTSLTTKTISKWAYEREYTLNQIIRENPGIDLKYQKAFVEAYARADYYRARLYFETGETSKARQSLAKVKFVHPRYLILYTVSFLPKSVWFFIHKSKLKNSLLPKLFKFIFR